MQKWIFQEDSITLSVILTLIVIGMACILLLPSAREAM